MFSYAIPYLIYNVFLFLVLMIESHLLRHKKSVTPIIFILIISILFFWGFRGFVFTDWYGYYLFFNITPSVWDNSWADINNFLWTNNVSSFEVGFKIFTLICKSIYPNYISLNFISLCFDITFFIIILKRYTNRYYAMHFLLLALYMGMQIEFNLLRNSKSIFLFIFSLKYIQEKAFYKYLLCNVIGMLFHSSAILFIPLYFVLNKDWSKKILLALFIIGNVIVLCRIHYIAALLSPILNFLGLPYAEKYLLDSDSSAFGFTFGFLERFLSFIVIWKWKDRIDNQFKNHIFSNCFFVFFLSYLFFAESEVVFVRASCFFAFCYWFVVPQLYILIRNRFKLIFLFFLFLYSFLKIGIITNSKISEYDNMLLRAKTYQERVILLDHYGTDGK